MAAVTVVSHQRWRADDLRGVTDVVSDLGLDTSAAADAGAVLWCPGAWAAAAVSRYPHLRLSSAGPRWLDGLAVRVTGRRVVTSSAGRIRGTGRRRGWRTFAKLPETKHEVFEARVRTHAELILDLDRLPDDEPVQLQRPVTFTDEVRCWVLRGEVVARAPYFADVAREDWAELADPERVAQAAAWLGTVIGRADAPAAFVVDVGWCADPDTGEPGWRIVEANAAWSADWYAADNMTAVVEVIAASQREVEPQWRWQPSPLLRGRSRALALR
ncbi:ATP-grasp domain-containing protein [Mycobacterium koreense]|uniref:ATP-grasp domain-containing protein n=1 Tax=Mycolicibacillus koreensis TaxID=1069220 RepID=A0A7I7SCZ9_9MYCO|nr:ATP-grasp domain-containing protein [Mycolicibacillus koreensis]MCV7247766.1 ATP-grasp domain-containing protein [Mycolicibacillus koreensis]OSC34714.1 hypothetical protein B8W67_05550 [Mycolicibacillus koreensis]BBY54149.1 hypothetical protein MKOR_14000 [Mycolicibacillus koreensis]